MYHGRERVMAQWTIYDSSNRQLHGLFENLPNIQINWEEYKSYAQAEFSINTCFLNLVYSLGDILS